MTDRERARLYARDLVSGSSRETLLYVIEAGKGIRLAHAAMRELTVRYPCNDCGAKAGRWCKPEYGCAPQNRAAP